MNLLRGKDELYLTKFKNMKENTKSAVKDLADNIYGK